MTSMIYEIILFFKLHGNKVYIKFDYMIIYKIYCINHLLPCPVNYTVY